MKIATKVSATGTIFGSVGNIQIADELAKLGHNIDPVSYTHLDVYKRQVLRSVLRRFTHVQEPTVSRWRKW